MLEKRLRKRSNDGSNLKPRQGHLETSEPLVEIPNF
jgi:hypothetical protein